MAQNLHLETYDCGDVGGESVVKYSVVVFISIR